MSQLYELDSKIFNVFGEKYIVFNELNSTLLNNKLFNHFGNQNFIDECFKILDGNSNEVNQSKMSLLIRSVLNSDYDSIINTIIEIFKTYFLNIANKIQNSITENNFTLSFFVNLYSDTNKKCDILIKNLNMIDKCIHSKNKHKYSTLSFIKNYIFYRIVLNKLYEFNDNHYYIYDLISKCEDYDSYAISDLIIVFKMHQYFYNISNLIKENQDKYFNIELNNKFTLRNDNLLLNKIMNCLNKKIELLLIIDTKTTNVDILLNEIRDLIKLGSEIFSDKKLFFSEYDSKLVTRLLSGKTNALHNADIENELLTSINYNNNKDGFIKIKQKISDIKNSIYYTDVYKNLNVTVTSEKYKNLLNKNNVDIRVLGAYAWNLKNNADIRLPSELQIHSDIFNKYYINKYPDRILNFEYDKSLVEIKMQLGNVYKIRMNYSQYCVFATINNSGSINGIDISSQTNIPLTNLSKILNSFLIVKLLNRQDGNASDPKLLFSINTNCVFDCEHVFLDKFMNQTCEISIDSLKYNTFELLKQLGSYSLFDIQMHLENIFNVKVCEFVILNILEQEIYNNNIIKINDKYSINDTSELLTNCLCDDSDCDNSDCDNSDCNNSDCSDCNSEYDE